MYLLFYSVLEQVDFSLEMFGVAIVQKSEFLFFVLPCILALMYMGWACVNLLLFSVSWRDLQKIYSKENIGNFVLCQVEPQNPYVIMQSLICYDTILTLMKLWQKKFSFENWEL